MPLTFEQWDNSQTGGVEQRIADAESGADREYDYDVERSMELAYEAYIADEYEKDMGM